MPTLDSSSKMIQQQLIKSRWFNLLMPMAIIGLMLFLLMTLLVSLSYHSIKNLAEKEVEERLLESASKIAQQLSSELKQVERLGVLLADQTRVVLGNHESYAQPNLMAGLQQSVEGIFFNPDTRQAAICLLPDDQQDKNIKTQKLQQLTALSPLLKDVYNSHFLINLAYFTTLESAAAVYPWLDLNDVFPDFFDVKVLGSYLLPEKTNSSQHQAFFTKAYLDSFSNSRLVTLSHPIVQQDTLLGIIGLDITLSRLSEYLAKISVPWGGYSLLMSAEGELLVSPDQAESNWRAIVSNRLQVNSNSSSLNLLDQSKFFNSLDPLHLDASGLINFEVDGENLLLSWSSVTPTGWKVVNIVATDKVFIVKNQLISDYLLIVFLVGSFLIFMFFILVLLVYRRDQQLVFNNNPDILKTKKLQPLASNLTTNDLDFINLIDGPLIICKFDNKELVIGCNLAFEHLVGSTKASLKGCDLIELLGLKSLDLKSLIINAQDNEIELRIGQQDAVNYWVSLHYTVKGEGVLLLLDISNYKKIQHQLIGDKQRTYLAEKMKSEFFQAAISDANGLLLELIKNARGFDDSLTNYCQNKLLDIQNLLDDIRDMSDSGELEQQELSEDVLVISLLVDDCYLSSKNLLANSGRHLVVELNTNLPEQLIMDRRRLLRLMRHLLRQLIQVSAKGDIYLELNWVGLNRLQILLQDEGGGLTENERLRRFQLTTPMSSSYESTSGTLGLGQLLTRQLVHEMRGSLEVDALPRGGLKLQIELPAKQLGDTIEHLAFGRILVVDDGPVNAMLASSVLEKSGYQVNVANGGAEALELGKEKNYDLVLMDIFMPDMDGLEATRLWRQLPNANAKVPIIALTANAMEVERQRFLEQGMNDYLAKPYKPNELRELVLRWLQKK